MIPVLHPADSTSWASFGLGALSDAIKCEVMEERNGQYELEMTYPVSGQHYSDLALRMIILAKPNFNDGPQPFRIYKISKPLNGIVTINAQHLCYDLSGYVDSAFSAVGVQSALIALTANCTPSPCPFTFASDMSTATGKLDVIKPTSIRALMGGTSGSLLDHWHGEWSYNGYVCRFDANRGQDRGVTIRYGKNLTSIKQEENNANVYTGIYPFWHNPDTKAVVTLPEKTINAPGTFTFTKICPVDLSNKFEEEPTQAQLREAAQAYIDSHDIGVPVVNLQLGFVQLEDIKERVDLCDTVHVYFDALGVNAAAKCVRTRWDVLADRYNKIELGSIRASIAGTITSIKETADQAHQATSTLADTARTVSERITGQLGGYVVMNDTDNDGEPDEILIMDAPDIEDAVNIIRMNNGGIAFSQDGYHGTYGTAWSIDGQFVADYITSGVLQANLIRILGTTNFYWDAGNIYIINPNDSGQQIRIGQYDGTRYGIGFTRDGGVTWQTAMDFQGLNVSATGFSKTYISLTPPDPEEYDLNIGDIWVESERRYDWNEVAEHTWSWAAQHTWQQLGGETDPNMYTWNGGSWQLIYDGESFTSFETRLTVAEQEIDMAVASVASKGVTYIQLTDPRNNAGVTVNFGDHWIKAEPGYNVITWTKAATMSWNTFAANYTWDGAEGPKEYAWDGYNWVLVSDHGAEVRNRTAIIETDKKITLMAQAQATMNDQLVENTAQLTVQANQIASEVTQRRNGETQLSSRITQNAQSITSEVSRAQGAEDDLSSLITQKADDIMFSVGRSLDGKYSKITGINITSTGITIAAGKKLQVAASDIQFVAAQTTLDDMLSDLDDEASGAASAAADAQTTADGAASAASTAQSTADTAKTAVTNITNGTTAVPKVDSTGFSIDGNSITLKATGALNFLSGGTLNIASGNFAIDAAGNVAMTGRITAKSGQIGGFDIGADTLSRTVEVQGYEYQARMYAPTTLHTTDIAFGIRTRSHSGSDYGPEVYWFAVNYAGELTAMAATIKGNITVDSITFSNGVTMSAANLTDGSIETSKISDGSIVTSKISDGSIATAKIANGAVSYSKGSSGVKTSLDNGDAAKASFDSLTSGSVKATYLKATYVEGDTVQAGVLTVKRNNSNLIASWKSSTIGGTTIYYLGRDSF